MSFAEMSISKFLETVASTEPAPGGGSVAALCGSLSASLVGMVAGLTKSGELNSLISEAAGIRQKLLDLVEEDSLSFLRYMQAPKDQKQQALQKTTLVPLETMEMSYRTLELAEEAALNGNKNAITDAGVAALLAAAAIQGAELNVKINLLYIKDTGFKTMVQERLAEMADYPLKTRALMEHVRNQLS